MKWNDKNVEEEDVHGDVNNVRNVRNVRNVGNNVRSGEIGKIDSKTVRIEVDGEFAVTPSFLIFTCGEAKIVINKTVLNFKNN